MSIEVALTLNDMKQCGWQTIEYQHLLSSHITTQTKRVMGGLMGYRRLETSREKYLRPCRQGVSARVLYSSCLALNRAIRARDHVLLHCQIKEGQVTSLSNEGTPT